MTRREMKQRILGLEERVAYLENRLARLEAKGSQWTWTVPLDTDTATWPPLGENGSDISTN